ncbi:hypothetical protein EVB81_093 [Rhizobium phage RHph_I46]|uniref:Uncharacterized protein n=1 Tax=Rhizobium phage RHph_I1_9 TaxID=2509729 RepID=A0A7S5RJC4_9CAUD|nr:hypothetical protein PP936_gp092 [Rhizobium phage RHph_I1_9]QIG69662.1 hypothetical protein EVB81_093 [Rhizobium phage RHph_I46]QIG70943.1 hypothetical protein EVB92_093 [Rhizobium phage RHph_I9]QIG73529.1 hypothetical protein EVC04_092 [Rhizobium phage RHph_I1_9]QIG76282.1 hypothetical protein EVC25_093 [Rhizobium phage RHph_I34]
MIRKTVLLGMNNPDPNDAFATQKKTGSGYRLLSFMNEYLRPRKIEIGGYDFERFFDRMNVLDTAEWDLAAAISRREEILEKVRGRRVIVCGASTILALGLNPDLLRNHTYSVSIGDYFNWRKHNKTTWCRFPHPSGANRLFNLESYRVAAGKVLWEEIANGVGWASHALMPNEAYLVNYYREPKERFSYPPT